MYGWISDGIYDHSGYLVRYRIVEGMPISVITKMWIENGGPEDISADMLLPWGSYPDFPPKPEKKS